MNTKQIRQVVAISALSLSIVIGGNALVKALGDTEFSTYPASPQSETQLVSSTSSTEGSHCLPDNATNSVLLAAAEGDSQIYQLWQMDIDGMPVMQVTTLFGQVCGKINDTRTFTNLQTDSLFDGMDEAVALDLAVQYYQKKIEQAGGTSAYQTGLEEILAESALEPASQIVFTTIDIEALKENGIELSGDNYEVREHVGYESL